MNIPENQEPAQPLAVPLSDGLGPVPTPKNCPFCGKGNALKLTTAQELAEQDSDYDGEFWEHSESWAVICDASQPRGPGGCGASGGFFETARRAVDAWNRRA